MFLLLGIVLISACIPFMHIRSYCNLAVSLCPAICMSFTIKAFSIGFLAILLKYIGLISMNHMLLKTASVIVNADLTVSMLKSLVSY